MLLKTQFTSDQSEIQIAPNQAINLALIKGLFGI